MTSPRETARQIAERFFKGGKPEPAAAFMVESLTAVIEAHVASLTADLAQARQDNQVLHNYIAARTGLQQGIEPQYDQSDADAFYLAEENHKLRQQLAAAEQARDEALKARDKMLDGLVEHQRHRDQWRGYAYGKNAKPTDFLDGNMSERPPTAIESAARTALLEAAEEAKTFGQMSGSTMVEWLTIRAGGQP